MNKRKRTATTTLSTHSSIRDTLIALRPRVTAHSFWCSRIDALERDLVSDKAARIHLAVFVEPYLTYVLDGTKTVESRFSVNRCAPFDRAQSGDVVLLKRSGGGVIGMCQITHSWYYNLDSSAWRVIKDRFAGPLAIKDPDFWKKKERACYASLFRISHIVTFDPLPFTKRDRRGWVVLSDQNEKQTTLLKL